MKRLSRLSPALALSIVSLVSCAPDENPAGPTAAEETTVPSLATATVANTWAVRAPMGTPRAGLKATAVNGIIYAIGGNDGTTLIRRTVEAYDPSTNSWTLKGRLPEPLQPTGATTLNGKIYVAGGLSSGRISPALYVYDPATNRWTRKADMPYKGTSFGGHQGAINGLLYVYLGMTTNPDGTVGPQRFLRYNPATNTWATLKVPSFARAGGASVVSSGRFYILGGKLPRGGGVTGQAADIHVYNPASNGWSKLTFSFGGYYSVHMHAYATSRGKLYITGSDYQDGWYGVNTVYDPATNTVASIAEPHNARYFAAGAGANGQFYAIGGYTCEQVSGQEPCQPSSLSGAVEAYTP
jgi:N-acetylneuraminic acid mutarotase